MPLAQPGRVNLSAYVDEQVHKEARLAMVRRGITWGGVLDEALSAWIKQQQKATTMDERFEILAMQELYMAARKSGVASAVAFTAGPEASMEPGPAPKGCPKETGHATKLKAPMLGSVVCLGFQRALNDAEKALVALRFPDRLPTWVE
jgi:hypothetical protein